MCASTDPASSWVCLLVSLLGVLSPMPARRLMRGLVIGAGFAGGVSFLAMIHYFILVPVAVNAERTKRIHVGDPYRCS